MLLDDITVTVCTLSLVPQSVQNSGNEAYIDILRKLPDKIKKQHSKQQKQAKSYKPKFYWRSDILRWDLIIFLYFFTSFSKSEPPGNPSKYANM